MTIIIILSTTAITYTQIWIITPFVCLQHETCCMLLIEWLSGLWGVSKLFLGPKMGRSKKKNSGLTAKPTTQPRPTPGPAFRSWIPFVSQVKKLSINLIRKKTRADFDAFKSTAFKGTDSWAWLFEFVTSPLFPALFRHFLAFFGCFSAFTRRKWCCHRVTNVTLISLSREWDTVRYTVQQQFKCTSSNFRDSCTTILLTIAVLKFSSVTPLLYLSPHAVSKKFRSLPHVSRSNENRHEKPHNRSHTPENGLA